MPIDCAIARLSTAARTIAPQRVRSRPIHSAAINAALVRITATFALGSGLAALGGALGADLMAMTPTYPFEQLVYFLIVVAIGGLGNLRGPFVGALLIGIGDTACKYWVPQFGAFFIYAATIAILLWRPAGLFGRRV